MDKKLICEASNKLRLKSINLFESNLKRFNDLPEEGELGQQLKLGVKPEKINFASTNQVTEFLRVHVDLGIRVVLVSDESENTEPVPMFQIEATYQVDYELIEPIEQAALDEFAKFNAVHNVWPFWRQYVFSIANQAGLPCPEVPLNTSLQSLENVKEESE